MSFFAASPFLNSLGWALLNSIWQFGVLWGIYWMITAAVKTLPASTKHSMSLYLLTAGTIWFILGLSWKFYSYPGGSEFIASGITLENSSYYNGYSAAQQYINKLMPYWSFLYLICIAFLFAKLCLFLRDAKALQTKGISKMSADWRMFVQNVAVRLGIEKEIKVFLSTHIDTPQVIGFLKPVILVPFACLTNLTTEQLEAVLLHELVHIKRNDYFINIFVATTEILFFFNPFVKQLLAAIRKEREYSCDDMVIQFQYVPLQYADALLTLEKNRKIPVTFGVAASGNSQGQLLTRVQRILGMKSHQNTLSVTGYLLSAMLLGFIALANPVKVAMEKIGTNLSFFVSTRPSIAAQSKELGSTIENDKIYKQSARHPSKKTKRSDTEPVVANDYSSSEGDEDLQTVANTQDPNGEENVQTTLNKMETRDFSLPEKNVAVVPGMTEEPSNPAPYVPSNSFSYQIISDTSHKKIKGETYAERLARETCIKTQKALQEIDWNKIEKELKYNKKQLAKLKGEMARQLAKLNWQKINKEVQEEQQSQKLQQIQEVLDQQQNIKQYQQTQVFYEALQKQLEEKDQLLKETDKRVKESQKELEGKEKRLLDEMKKRRIIYI